MQSTPPANRTSRFEALFDAIVDAVIVIDETGTISAFNPAAESLFGWQREQILGRGVEQLMPRQVASEHSSYVERYLATKEPRIIGIGREVECKRRDGSTFPAHLAVGEGWNDSEHFFVGILRDLSETQRLQRSLARSEAELRTILDHSLVATAMLDDAGKFLTVNQACIDLVGISGEAILDLDIVSVTAQPERPAVVAALEQVPRTGGFTMRHRCQHTSGAIRVGLLHLTQLPGPDPESANLLMQFIDETERIDAEQRLARNREQLAEVSRLSVLGEMAAGIAHEINQPLGAISNYAEACRNRLGADSDPQVLELLSKISGQSQRAGEVIRRLRGAARGQGADASALSVPEVVDDAIQLAGLDARFVGVEVITEFEEQIPSAYADRVAVQQVLLNLLRNAVDATAAAGGQTIAVRVADATEIGEPGVLISVRDEGSGVDPAIAPRILHPFFTTKETGMGVGLALCETLLNENRGRLWFENNGDAADGPQGATFHILLPALEEPTSE